MIQDTRHLLIHGETSKREADTNKSPDRTRHRAARSAQQAGDLEWVRLQELVTRIAAETDVHAARFRWKSAGHHLMLGPVVASFTFATDAEDAFQGMHIAFGGVPSGMHGDKSSLAPKVWDVLPVTHDNKTVVWAMNDGRLLLSEKLAAEIVTEVVKFYDAAKEGSVVKASLE